MIQGYNTILKIKLGIKAKLNHVIIGGCVV